SKGLRDYRIAIVPETGRVRGGCAGAGTPPLVWLVLFLAGAAALRRRAKAGALIAFAALSARAETPRIDISPFRPASGGDGLASVEGARPLLAREGLFELRLWVDDAIQPLVYLPDSGGRQVLVQNRAAGWLAAQVHLVGPLSIAAQLPMLLAQNGNLSSLPALSGPSSF